MKEEHFLIKYHSSIPLDVIDEYKQNLKDFNVIVEKQEDEEYFYADASIINDIIIYISQNQTALIVSGLIVRATYDLIKFSITKLIDSLKTKAPKEKLQNKLSVKHQIGDKTLEFEIETNLSEDLVEKIIEQSFQILKDERTKEIINNKDYLSKESDYTEIKFFYNKEKELWMPVNYKKQREEYENFLRKANEDLTD